MTKIHLQDNEYLKIYVYHRDGQYRLSVTKIFEEDMFETSWPMANGNFYKVLLEGRKSAKKLDRYNEIIQQNQEALKSLWLNEHYYQMVELIENKF